VHVNVQLRPRRSRMKCWFSLHQQTPPAHLSDIYVVPLSTEMCVLDITRAEAEQIKVWASLRATPHLAAIRRNPPQNSRLLASSGCTLFMWRIFTKCTLSATLLADKPFLGQLSRWLSNQHSRELQLQLQLEARSHITHCIRKTRNQF
jgi:hypothetical protein